MKKDQERGPPDGKRPAANRHEGHLEKGSVTFGNDHKVEGGSMGE